MSPTYGMNGERADGRVEVQEYLRVLLRRKWIVLFAFAGVVASSWIGSLLAPRVYEATATLQLGERELGIGSALLQPVEQLIGAKTSYIDSEAEILRSQTLAGQVVRKLNLDKRVGAIPENVFSEFL